MPPVIWLMFFLQHRQRRYCANKARLECERFFSARVSDLMWTSVWSGNLLSSEVISLTHCIIKWWGGPSSKNRVTWPRYVAAATAFCLVSLQKWFVLFLCLIYRPYWPFQTDKFFLHWYFLLYYQLSRYIVNLDHVTWTHPILVINCHMVWLINAVPNTQFLSLTVPKV